MIQADDHHDWHEVKYDCCDCKRSEIPTRQCFRRDVPPAEIEAQKRYYKRCPECAAQVADREARERVWRGWAAQVEEEAREAKGGVI
jgi:hypothetical protein